MKPDGPPYYCLVCLEEVEIEAGHYHIGDARIHSDCLRRFWSEPSRKQREIGGGSAASPWTLFFDLGIARRAGRDRLAHGELLAASAEARFAAGEMRTLSRGVCAMSAARRRAADASRLSHVPD